MTALVATSSRLVLGQTQRRVRLTSGDIAYLDEGAGPPILLLHGAPFTSLGFARMIRELRSSYRVLAPDLPGFGASVSAPGFGGSLAEYSRFINEFCEALELRDVTVFGCDSSACMAQSAAAADPERVRGLVVADTVPIPMTGIVALVRFVLRYVVSSRWVRFVNRRWNLFAWLVATIAPLRRPFSSKERAVMVAQYATTESRERIVDVFSRMAREDTFLGETAAAVRARLRNKPVLLIYGQFDPMRFLGGVGRYLEVFPRASVHIVPWEEHFPMLASAENVAAAMKRWLGTLELSKVPTREETALLRKHSIAGKYLAEDEDLHYNRIVEKP